MIVDFNGEKMNPSVVAKALFYHYGCGADVSDPAGDVYKFEGATEREVGLIAEQFSIVCTRMSKQLLGK